MTAGQLLDAKVKSVLVKDGSVEQQKAPQQTNGVSPRAAKGHTQNTVTKQSARRASQRARARVPKERLEEKANGPDPRGEMLWQRCGGSSVG